MSLFDPLLIATMSHELRTPLTSIMGYSEMLLEGLAGPLNETQHEYLAIVFEKSEHLLSIITGILDLSKIEAGQIQLVPVPFDVSEVIGSALTTVLPAARRKQLEVESELPPGLPKPLGDRDKLRQVVVNLLSNAVKFTPPGGRVTVRAEAVGAMLRIAVADSGIGISEEAQAKIFDPFFQVDGSSTREYGGTGLGLAIVKSFVEAHGGHVGVASIPNQGSSFWFTLPLAPSPG